MSNATSVWSWTARPEHSSPAPGMQKGGRPPATRLRSVRHAGCGFSTNLSGNTAELGNGATFTILNNFSDSYSNPTLDPGTLVGNMVPGTTATVSSVLNLLDNNVNEGTILANGPAGSIFTINVGATNEGAATIPGYFYTVGTIEADAGNTVIINIGSAAEMFNTGMIIANGGSVKVNVLPGAIAGGDGSVRGFDLIEGGGTLETQATFPTTGNGSRADYIFADGTPGNTLKDRQHGRLQRRHPFVPGRGHDRPRSCRSRPSRTAVPPIS